MSHAATGLAQRQTVTIRVGPNGEITAHPDPFTISKGNQEEVIWRIEGPEQDFTVEFEGESPFYEGLFTHKFSASGLTRRKVEPDPEKVYKYTIKIGPVGCDPGGIITR